jgi:predicted membrane channel-forming protein YqfA (hemolysin III family)
MRNRTSFYIVAGLVSLAVLGIISQLIDNPGAFFRSIAIMVLIVAVIFFLINRFSKAGPQKHEQRAFNKAAKHSKKRFQHKDSSSPGKRTSIGSLSAARKKKKDTSHLTVIEGKKGKKKNRASF